MQRVTRRRKWRDPCADCFPLLMQTCSISEKPFLFSKLSRDARQRGQEIDQRPDLLRRMARGNYDFTVETDYDIRELEREAEQNGYVLEWNFDRDNNDFEYTCRKMTPEEYEDYVAWEQEE